MYDSVWIVVASFIFAFFLAFAIGANDVANTFGTSVGSHVLTLRQACILATIFEILGSITLGYNVSSTIKTGIINTELFDGESTRFMMGYLSALIGSSIWNIVATLMGLPVSGTHSIVGAIIGFAISSKGIDGVNWHGMIPIVISWFVSPLASGFVSVVFYLLIRFFIINHTDSLPRGLVALPFFYAFTVFVNIFSVILKGPSFLKMPIWASFGCSAAIGGTTFVVVMIFVVPYLRDRTLSILNKLDDLKARTEQTDIGTAHEDEGEDKTEVACLFTFLQILTACFGSFAHGANDVSNAIAPLVAVMLLYTDRTPVGASPFSILLFGGMSITIGLWAWGRRVIKTMGNDLTKITPSTGFTIELGAALTVVACSKMGLPVSTTHCKVGSVVAVGRVHMQSRHGVNWKLFANIATAWVATVPISALFSGLAMYGLETLYGDPL